MRFGVKFLCGVILAVLLAGYAHACDDCDKPGMVDADDAYAWSLRDGRDAVEGFWGIYVDWNPDTSESQSYRMAIVKNRYGVYPEADYIGVATCDSGGCEKGEVKLLLSSTKKKNEFKATLLTKNGGAKGTAILADADDGRKDCALDMRNVKYSGNMMAGWMIRIIGG